MSIIQAYFARVAREKRLAKKLRRLVHQTFFRQFQFWA
jgi:hypothetical protein